MIPATDRPLQWLYVDLNSYFASVEQQEDPSIAGQPVIVTPVESEYTGAIAVSYEAKALGIRNGMSVREAREIYPGIHIRCARHDVYVAYHQRIIAEIDRHLPVEKVCSIDEMACRLQGRDAEVETAAALGQAIQIGLMRSLGRSMRCSVGIAPSLLLAKMASDMKKPLGLTILPFERLPDDILRLSISDIPGVGRRMQARLERAQCLTMEDVWRLSPSRARALWGSIEGERVWYGLHGIDPAERPVQNRKSIGHSVILASGQRNFTGAKQAARGLLMLAASRLRQMDYSARHLDIFLSIEPDRRACQSGQFALTQDTFALIEQFDRLWRMFDPALARERIKKTGIVLSRLQHAEDRQPDLFDTEQAPRSKGQRASQALDKLNQKFGRSSVRIGEASAALSKYSGAKIAFNRIPNALDFK